MKQFLLLFLFPLVCLADRYELTRLPTAGGRVPHVVTLTNGQVLVANVNGFLVPATPGTLTDGDKGDITVSAGGSSWLLDNLVVTNAKIANGTIDLTTKVTGILPAANSFLGADIDLGSAEATGTLAAGRFPALTGAVTTTAGSLATSIANNAVTLGTHTTGNYAAGDAEAGAALTGDTATAFFSAGTLEDARLSANVSLLGSSIDLGSAEAAGTLAAARFPALTGAIVTTAGSLATSISNDAVTLGTHTIGNYAAGDAEAGAALTGDTATAFFSAGTLEDARLSANVSLLGGSIDLGSEVTGALPPANGGTGQVTIQAAVNALMAASGALSQGDVFYFNGTNIVRLAAGTAGQLFQTAGAGANPLWATVGALTDGDKGDISVSASGATWTVDNDVVTYAKQQDVSATSRIIGRKTAGAGDPEELTLSEALDFVGSAANGDILYRSGGSWTRLGAGTNGHVLTLASGLPTWAAGGGGSGAVVAQKFAAKTDTQTTTSIFSTAWVDITGLSITYTPTSASNKIRIRAVVQGMNATANSALFRVVRDSTALHVGDAGGANQPRVGGSTGGGTNYITFSIVMAAEETGPDTSAHTYKVQFAVTAAGTAYVNRNADDTNQAYNPRAASSITVEEVTP